jgi:hypothetical protein
MKKDILKTEIIIYILVIGAIFGCVLNIVRTNVSEPNIINKYINNTYWANTITKDNADNIDYQIRNIRWCNDDATLRKANGMSMFPYSWSEGWHWVEPVKFKDIEIGDVISYKKNKSNIHHVVVNVYRNSLITRGYHNSYNDVEVVLPGQIISRDCMPQELK